MIRIQDEYQTKQVEKQRAKDTEDILRKLKSVGSHKTGFNSNEGESKDGNSLAKLLGIRGNNLIK
jgi:hypothetical protein